MSRVRLDPCTRRGCYKGATVYGPHHSSTCPRHRPNVTHHCGDCGAPVNYHEHAAWCTQSASEVGPAIPQDIAETLFIALGWMAQESTRMQNPDIDKAYAWVEAQNP